MDLKVLNSIMHGELMPWSMDMKSKAIAEKLKAIGNKEPEDMQEVTKYVRTLVSDMPDLIAWFNKRTTGSSVKLADLYFISELPSYSNSFTKFYSQLIKYETLRIYNDYLIHSSGWTNKIDIIYHTTILLRSIKTLTKQITAEINQITHDGPPDEESDPYYFTLYYLKHSLIPLYFSVQEAHKSVLEDVISLEDFYLLELNEPISSIRNIYPAKNKELVEGDHKPKTEFKINFGFKGKPDNLKTIITQLNFKVNLLKEGKTSPDDLLSVLTSRNLIPGSTIIYLDCETATFRYIIDKLDVYFSDFKLINIEKSEIFKSKKGKPIKANNLSSSRIENPKLKDDIDKIFQQMQ